MIHTIYLTTYYRYRRCHRSIFYGSLLVLYQPTRWRHNPSIGHTQLKMLFVFTLQMFKYKWKSPSINKKKSPKSWNNRTYIACIVSTFIGVRRKFVVAWKRQRLTKVVLSRTENKKHNTYSSAHLICLNEIRIPPRSLKTDLLSAASGRFRWVTLNKKFVDPEIYPGCGIKRGVF